MDAVETFTQYRPLLFSIAYRMLGSAMDAEDLVQETYLRWQAATPTTVDSPKAFLSTIITRLCIDQWRSARVQREDYIGPWLPEPILIDPAPEAAMLADSLSIAFMTVLESLSPLERAVYLLREVFDYEYAEIARIVDKSEANCRQMAKRAKDHLAEKRPRFDVRPEEHQRILVEFAQACATGDVQRLASLLAEDVVEYTDSGGQTQAARNPIYGPDKVARFTLGVLQKMPDNFVARPAIVNGLLAVVGYIGQTPYVVQAFDIAEGRIRRVYAILNPEKLKGIPPLADE